MNFNAIRAIYKYEMARTRRTIMQSVVSPVISTSRSLRAEKTHVIQKKRGAHYDHGDAEMSQPLLTVSPPITSPTGVKCRRCLLYFHSRSSVYPLSFINRPHRGRGIFRSPGQRRLPVRVDVFNQPASFDMMSGMTL